MVDASKTTTRVPLVGVVILNWNQAAFTRRAVDHVLRQRDVPGDVSVIVVDNGSRDDDIAVLERELPAACQLLRNQANLGFAGGMNVGIQAALRQGCRFVWALNNDAFAEPDCLAALVSAMDADPALAAITPRLLNGDGSLQILSAEIDWETGSLKPLPAAAPIGKDTWYVTGAALFLRAAAVSSEPVFDERFFAYWEDTDLCVRLLTRQWRIGVVDVAVCVHLGSASAGMTSPFVVYLMTRNVSLFLRRHQGWLPWFRASLRHAAVQLVHAVTLRREGQAAAAQAICAGLWDGFRGKYGVPARLALRGRHGDVVLRHYWFLARLMWRTAHTLSPQAWRRRPESSLTLAAVLNGRADA